MFATTNNPIRTLILLLLLLLGGAGLQAQTLASDFVDLDPQLNSPLSRFGLGNPLDQVHVAQRGMAGLRSTYQDHYHLNIQNPASLATLRSTSLEVGAYGRYAELSDRNASVNTNQGNLSYLALGFPLRNPLNLSLEQQDNSWNAGMALSVAQTTAVGYDLLLTDDDEEFGQTSNILRGSGGAYRFTWSTAGRYKSLAAGINLNYNFGKVTNSRVVVLNELDDALGSELLEDFVVNGVSFGYGVQYSYEFKSPNDEGEIVPNGKRIIVGADGNFGANVRNNSSQLLRRFSPSGGVFVNDTVVSVTEEVGEITLPSSYNFGVAFEDFNRLYIGVEYGQTQGEEFRNTARPDVLQNGSRLAFGLQYIPNAGSYNSYWKRMRYRAGVRLEEDGRALEGVQARRNAVTLGAGFPLRLPRQQVSFIDFAVELGQFGVPDILDENYIQVSLGFSLNDNSWFFKRKLN